MDERLLKGHTSTTCWQYDIRNKNYEEDIKEAGFTKKYVSTLECSDFDFRAIEDIQEREKLIKFIQKHEWLGKISQYTTHWFGAYHKEKLAGVLLFNMPNAFSKLLGDDTPELERLISRGACISWSPKGLGSKFIMWAIKWMVENTRYRLFTAYSDPNAKELGTIYQACGFYYLGKTFGTSTRYINPYSGKIVSDRFFRTRSAYKKYAKELGIVWQKNWTNERNTGMMWDNIPDDVEEKLRKFSKAKQAKAKTVAFPLKHKYAFVLGKDKRETRKLRKEFLERNKVKLYPKERGK
jgi:hypothetical protein